MKTDSYQVAIVEDDSQASSQLKEMLLRFGGESFVSFEVDTYSDGLKFISSFHAQYDLVFLDIEMPYLNGMDTAKKIRETDKNVLIVFVTNLAQFALEGYEVQAFDFILKPITYPNLKMKLMRMVTQLQHDQKDHYIMITTKTMSRKISVASITYLEVKNHYVLFHFLQDEPLQVRSTLSSWEKELSDDHFVRCNSYTLVNLQHVDDIQLQSLMVHGETLYFSRNKRMDFLQAFSQYVGGTK